MKDFLENDQEGSRLREQLKQAVRSQATPTYLETRIRSRIRGAERRTFWSLRLVPVAAAVVVCLGAVIAYQLGHLRLTIGSQNSYIASVSNHIATLMRVGLGDHLHCSVFRKFPKNPPSIDTLTESMAAEYRELIPIVRKQVSEDYRLVLAHQCRYNGRKFVHLSLRSDSRLLSLVIARKGDGESFKIENMAPSLAQAGIPFYRAGVQRFEIAAFESRDHLVYFVSDLPQQQNMQMMLALAPQVQGFLHKLEI